jgi:DNA repair photolyase
MQVYSIRGRGAAHNPKNRFETLEVVLDDEARDPDDRGPRTQYLRDSTRSIIARNDSPDIGFDTSVNPYRGCEHGCIYCYARPTHEYLGFSAGLDFESRILVKTDAPALLREALQSPRWTPQVIMISGVTDPYQPIERKLGITRGCLEVLAEFRNPVAMISKNHLITRDADILGDMAKDNAAAAALSITSLDEKLQRVLEPRTSIPARRLAAVETLAKAGVPVRVMIAPVIPGLNDTEVPAIVRAAADAGACAAGWIMVRLPHAVAPLFEDWLGRHFPDRKDKVLNRLRAMRGGKLYDSSYGKRMRGEGVMAEQIGALFDAAIRKYGLDRDREPLSTDAFRRPAAGGQLGLFD